MYKKICIFFAIAIIITALSQASAVFGYDYSGGTDFGGGTTYTDSYSNGTDFGGGTTNTGSYNSGTDFGGGTTYSSTYSGGTDFGGGTTYTNSYSNGTDFGGGTTYSNNEWLPCSGGSCYTNTTYSPSYNYSYCSPSTCSQRGYQCGSWNDGCNGTIYCGACGYNQICSGGFCVTSGSNCQASSCSMLGYQCGNYSDGCGGTMYCGSCGYNQVCSTGRCVAGGTNCQPQTCSQLGMQCGNVYDGCSGNINCGSCYGNQTCQNGHCVSTCSNQCSSGQTRCFGNGIQTCRDSNGDGCTEWDGVTNCGYNQNCQNGSCQASCQPRSCSQMGYQCGNFNDGCGNTIYCGSCGYNQSCSNGRCESNCSDQCSQGERRCSGNGYQVCGGFDGDNCNSWGPTISCGGNQECNNGNCQNDYQHDNVSNFSVSLYASPSSGCAPLDNISLTATVSGYSNNNNYNSNYGNDGQFTYYFSCDGDGNSDRTVTTYETSVTVNNVCGGSQYRNYGNQTASVRVTRDGYEANGQTTVNVTNCNSDNNTGKQLKVALYTDPTSGCTPLNGVSLRALVTNADVSGYNGNGYNDGRNYDLTYSFDCDNNGTFEKTVDSGETEVVVNGLCNYPSNGIYTARVRVDNGGRFATDTAIVKVNYCQNNVVPPVYVQPNYVQPNLQPNYNGSFSVQKSVANLSNGTAYQSGVTANPGDIVSFKVIVNAGSSPERNLTISDIMPATLINPRDLRVDGQSVLGGIISGISIGDLNTGQQRVITFSATVAQASNFPYGQTALTDTASARNDSASNSSTATVYVWRQAVLGATSVSTGILGSDWMNYLVAGVIALLAAIWLFRDKLAVLLTSLKTRIYPVVKKI